MINLEQLRKLYQFSKDLDLKDAEKLIRSSRSESVKKNTILFEQGSKGRRVYFLRKGLVRVYHIKDSGEEITFNLIPEYHIVVNFEYVGMKKESSFYYETLEDSTFFSMDYDRLEHIVSNNPTLDTNRKYVLRRFLFKSVERVKSFVLMNAEERYLKFLRDFPDLNDRVPDKYIAQMLGITPVSLSRIRKRILLKG